VRPASIGNLVLGATITANTISSCLLNPFDDDLRNLTQIRGLGGISLGLASGLVITENIIEANGRNQLDPVCGIFIGIGDQLEIHRNQIADNGAIETQHQAGTACGNACRKSHQDLFSSRGNVLDAAVS
jgi:hypothetical protein